MIFYIIKIKLPVLANLISGLFGQYHLRNKTPVFFAIGSTKFFVQYFHYSISIQIIICDILCRLSLPLVFETFVIGAYLMAGTQTGVLFYVRSDLNRCQPRYCTINVVLEFSPTVNGVSSVDDG